MLVTEHTDGHDLWRQTFHDVACQPRRDLARTWCKHKTQSIRTERYCQQRILFIGDPTNLDKHGYDTNNLRTDSSGSPEVTIDSPTNTASYPAFRRRRASVSSRTPDSATRIADAGINAAIRSAR